MNTTIDSVYVVKVEGREDGIYLFRNREDALRFGTAVADAGGDASLDELPINHAPTTDELIAQELS